METRKVAKDNVMFFITAVGMAFGIRHFVEAVLHSSIEESQFPTDCTGNSGYIRIDSSPIRKKGDDFWYEFVDKIREEGFLTKISYGFCGDTKFNGDFSDKVTIEEADYVFSFHIRQYERDAEHGFEIINPEDLKGIPEDEILGRVVYLTITQKD